MAQGLIGALPAALAQPHGRAAGTLRVCSPQDTMDRVRPHFGRMGLTRVADITGLDRLGLPVTQAVRPMAKSLSVKQGKGVCLDQAMVSATMEATESWHAEQITAPTPRMPPRAHVDLSAIAARRVCACEAQAKMSWLEGWNLVTESPIFAPYDVVTLDFTAPLQCNALERSSNGLASGNTLSEALCHGLCEVVERDCIADFYAKPYADRCAAMLSDAQIDSYGAAWMRELFVAANLMLVVWDVTNDLGVPAFRAVTFELASTQLGPGRAVYAPREGYGCHLDPAVAIERAICEAAQSRLVLIAGARDDLKPADYQPAPNGNRAMTLSLMAEISAAKHAAPTRKSKATAHSEGDVREILDRLKAAGLTQIAAFDLTDRDIGVPVVRVVAAGLGGLMQGHKTYQGARHRRRYLS